jgi:hypothetical protein
MVDVGPLDDEEPPERLDNLTDRQRTFIRRVEEAHQAGRPYTGEPDDDRWDWIETARFDGQSEWIKGRCYHKTPEPVDAYPTGELVRWLCPDCGQTFEPDRWPVPEGMWIRIPDPVLNSPEVPGLFTPSKPQAESNGFEKWVYGNASPSSYEGPCPHLQADWHKCAVCTAPDSDFPGLAPKIYVRPLAPGMVITYPVSREPWPIRATTKVIDCLEGAWEQIKMTAEWAVLAYPVWIVAVYYVGVTLGWW